MKTITDYINECKELFEANKSEIIIRGNKTTFSKFNYLEALNNSSEIYSYSGISNSVGYFNDYLIEYKTNILFNEMEILSLKKHEVPYILLYNIITLRFLNFNLNTSEGIKKLIGYFYSTNKVLNQLYSYGITDSMLFYYFNVNSNLKFITEPSINPYYSDENTLMDQKTFYSKYRNQIHHKYQRWIKDATRISEDTGNVVKKVLLHIKNNYILNSIYKNIYSSNKSITQDDYKQFLILNEDDKIKCIKNLISNQYITIPYYLTPEAIYTLVYDELKSKYNCNTFSINFINDFLSNNKIKLQEYKNYDEVEVKINLLIKQGYYQKGKLKEICNYLDVSENTFRKIITLKNLPKPFQYKLEDVDYSEYFKERYPVEIDNYIEIKKKVKEYENTNDGNIIEETDNTIFEKKKIKQVGKWSNRNKNTDWNFID